MGPISKPTDGGIGLNFGVDSQCDHSFEVTHDLKDPNWLWSACEKCGFTKNEALLDGQLTNDRLLIVENEP